MNKKIVFPVIFFLVSATSGFYFARKFVVGNFLFSHFLDITDERRPANVNGNVQFTSQAKVSFYEKLFKKSKVELSNHYLKLRSMDERSLCSFFDSFEMKLRAEEVLLNGFSSEIFVSGDCQKRGRIIFSIPLQEIRDSFPNRRLHRGSLDIRLKNVGLQLPEKWELSEIKFLTEVGDSWTPTNLSEEKKKILIK